MDFSMKARHQPCVKYSGQTRLFNVEDDNKPIDMTMSSMAALTPPASASSSSASTGFFVGPPPANALASSQSTGNCGASANLYRSGANALTLEICVPTTVTTGNTSLSARSQIEAFSYHLQAYNALKAMLTLPGQQHLNMFAIQQFAASLPTLNLLVKADSIENNNNNNNNVLEESRNQEGELSADDDDDVDDFYDDENPSELLVFLERSVDRNQVHPPPLAVIPELTDRTLPYDDTRRFELENYIDQIVVSFSGYTKRGQPQLLRSFLLGEALFHLRFCFNRNAYHPYIRQRFNFCKTWTNMTIKLFASFRDYPKLLKCSLSVRKMVNLSGRIHKALTTPEGREWYENMIV